MTVLRLETKGFGCLKGNLALQPTGINVLVAPNEQGKSTIAAAILEALYGAIRPSKRGIGAELAPFEPVDSESFDVTLWMKHENRVLIIHRDFKAGQVRVSDTSAGEEKDITEEFRSGKDALVIGDKLLGLTRDEFKKSIFVAQDDLSRLKDGKSLTAALQRIADTSIGKVTAEEAIQILNRGLSGHYQYSLHGKPSVTTEIARLQESLAEARQKLGELTQRKQQSDGLTAQLDSLAKKRQDLRLRLDALSYREAQAHLDQVDGLLQADDEKCTRIQSLEGDLLKYERWATFPVDTKPRVEAIGVLREERTRDLKGRLETIELKEKLKQELEASIREFGQLAGWHEEARSGLATLCARIEEAELKLDASRNACEETRASLVAKDIDFNRALDRLSGLERHFEILSPEDKTFLRAVAAEIAQSERALATMSAARQDLLTLHAISRSKLKRLKTFRAALMSIGGAGALLLLLGFLITHIQTLGWLALLCIVSCFGSRFLNPSIRTLAARQAELDHKAADLQSKQTEVKAHLSQLLSRKDQLRQNSGLGQESEPDFLLLEYERLKTELEPLTAKTAIEASAVQALRALQLEAQVWLGSKGLSIDVSSSSLKSTLSKAVEVAALNAKRQLLDTKLKDLRSEATKLKTGLSDLDQELLQIGQKANISEELPISSVADKLKDGFIKAERYKEIARQLASARIDLLTPERRQLLQGERAQYLSQLQDLREFSSEDFLSLTLAECRHEIASAQRELETIAAQEMDVRGQYAGEINRLQTEQPYYQERIDELQERLLRANRFKAAIETAMEAMSRLSREVHSVWGKELNAWAASTLAQVFPAGRELHFGENLSIEYRLGETGALIDVANEESRPGLSRGARDQIYLIARLAVAEFLSKDVYCPPLILDDPFVHTDDDRFLRLMTVLARLSADRRQILLFTCHQTRHAWLRQQHPEQALHELQWKGDWGIQKYAVPKSPEFEKSLETSSPTSFGIAP